MASKIPEGITREHIVAALHDLDAGISHRFGDSTAYDLIYEGRRYPPKAVVGLAVGKLLGSPLGPYDFKGGLESTCFAILRKNGFEITFKLTAESSLGKAAIGIHQPGIRSEFRPIIDYAFQRYSSYDRESVAAALEPSYRFQSQVGSWGISGIVRFNDGPNYVFFVSFGQKQADHEFDEAVYENGIIRWQSQPRQKLTDPTIRSLVAHDHLAHDILLFLRTTKRGPYVFMGFLKYVNHDAERERPVNFHWEILDFDSEFDYESAMGLQLQPAPDNDEPKIHPPAAPIPPILQLLTQREAPQNTGRGTRLSTREFRATVVDYEERDRKNRGLGKAGELLVLEQERKHLTQLGRPDLAAKVEAVCWTLGDGLGYDIRSFDPGTEEEIHIEVKTTTGHAETPFYMSASEVEYASNCGARYKIARVYNYTTDEAAVPFFILENPFAEQQLDLTPVSYRVRLK